MYQRAVSLRLIWMETVLAAELEISTRTARRVLDFDFSISKGLSVASFVVMFFIVESIARNFFPKTSQADRATIPQIFSIVRVCFCSIARVSLLKRFTLAISVFILHFNSQIYFWLCITHRSLIQMRFQLTVVALALGCILNASAALVKRFFVLVTALLSRHGVQGPGGFDPVANPRAVVRAGRARFTVLTEQLIRMEWSATNQFQDDATWAFIIRNLPVPVFNASQQGGWQVITTRFLNVCPRLFSKAHSCLKNGELSLLCCAAALFYQQHGQFQRGHSSGIIMCCQVHTSLRNSSFVT